MTQHSHVYSVQGEKDLTQIYFNNIFFTTISAFENVASKCNRNSNHSKYSYYNCCNENESIDEAISKAISNFQLLISCLDELRNKGQKVDFPYNVELKSLQKDINTWISEIKAYDPSLFLNDNCLETMNEFISEKTKMARASEYCYRNAFEKSKGECSAHVRDALNHAGFDFPKENFHAYKFYKDEKGVKNLEIRGFKEMPLEEGFEDKQDGDIVVEEAKGKNKYGHIQIYNSKHGQWVSDFKQKSEAMVHSSDIGERHYYRYCPKFRCLKYQNNKKKKIYLDNYFPICRNERDSKSINYDRYNNSSSSYYVKHNNSGTSFNINDRVSIEPSIDISRDIKIGFNANVEISIPCIIF